MFPEVGSFIEQIVLMGGAVGSGNTNPCAEFNMQAIFSDSVPTRNAVSCTCLLPILLQWHCIRPFVASMLCISVRKSQDIAASADI